MTVQAQMCIFWCVPLPPINEYSTIADVAQRTYHKLFFFLFACGKDHARLPRVFYPIQWWDQGQLGNYYAVQDTQWLKWRQNGHYLLSAIRMRTSLPQYDTNRQLTVLLKHGAVAWTRIISSLPGGSLYRVRRLALWIALLRLTPYQP